MIRITDPENVAPILSELRQMTRMTTRGLAADAGANQGQICTWLNGQRIPNTPSLIRLANALGYDSAPVPSQDDDEKPPETARISPLTAGSGSEAGRDTPNAPEGVSGGSE